MLSGFRYSRLSQHRDLSRTDRTQQHGQALALEWALCGDVRSRHKQARPHDEDVLMRRPHSRLSAARSSRSDATTSLRQPMPRHRIAHAPLLIHISLASDARAPSSERVTLRGAAPTSTAARHGSLTHLHNTGENTRHTHTTTHTTTTTKRPPRPHAQTPLPPHAQQARHRSSRAPPYRTRCSPRCVVHAVFARGLRTMDS